MEIIMHHSSAPARRFSIGAAAAAVLAGSALFATDANAANWKYAFEEAIHEVQGVYAQKFKEEVEKNSDHTIQLFPYGTLGESADIMEQAQAGILEFVDQSPGFTGSLIPEAQVFFVPYLLPTDQKHLARFYRESKAINEDFKKLYAEKGLELLTMFPEGEVAMTTKEPVRSCADLNEVKFRVMTNPLLVESYKAFGATPTPLPWGEVYGGLQTNIIQGQENPTFFLYSTKIYEVTEHITYAGHNNFTTAVMANKDFYDGLQRQGPESDPGCSQGGLRPHRRVPGRPGPDRAGQDPQGQAGDDGHRAERRTAEVLQGRRRRGRGQVHRDDR